MTYTSLTIVIGGLITLAIPTSQASSLIPEPTAAIDAAASTGLLALRSTTTPDDLAAMGLRSPDELSGTKLQKPIPLYLLSKTAIRSFQPGQDPTDLLTKSVKFFYPVRIGSMVVGSVLVEETKDGWKGDEFGDPETARAVTKTLDQSAQISGVPITQYFIVQIWGREIYFIAHQSNGKLLLQSVFDVSELHLKAGQEESAEKVIEALKPLSQQLFDAPS